jgi:hypothetical protein
MGNPIGCWDAFAAEKLAHVVHEHRDEDYTTVIWAAGLAPCVSSRAHARALALARAE